MKPYRRIRLGPSVLFPGQVKYTTVDAEDYELAISTKWWPQRRGDAYYAGCRGKYLHRLITKATKRHHVDHRDGNGLDNRKRNLRKTSRSGNERNRQRLNKNNSSGVAGVSKAWGGRWTVSVWLGSSRNKCVVATLDTLQEAAEVRRCAEVLAYGRHAPKLRRPATGKLVGKFGTLNELIEHFSFRRQRARKRQAAA